jgi:hypothetical protein
MGSYWIVWIVVASHVAPDVQHMGTISDSSIFSQAELSFVSFYVIRLFHRLSIPGVRDGAGTFIICGWLFNL